MERKKLLEEYKVTLESLVAKTNFVYSEDFYKLDDFEKQKYQKDKMATEAHLSTLCEVLWGEKMKFESGLCNMFALGILGSMFNYGGGIGSQSPNMDYLKNALGEQEHAQEIENVDI